MGHRKTTDGKTSKKNGETSQTQMDSHLDQIHNYINNKEERSLGVFLLNEIDRSSGLTKGQIAYFNFIKATLLIELYKEDKDSKKSILKSAESLLKEIKIVFRFRPEQMKASYRIAAIRVKLLLATNGLSKPKEIGAYIKQASIMIKGAMSVFTNNIELNELAIELENLKPAQHDL